MRKTAQNHPQFVYENSENDYPCSIDELRQWLVDVADSDVFKITEDLRAIIHDEVNAILETEKDEPK